MIRNDKRSNPRKTFRAVAICAILLFAIYLIINTTAVNTFIASLLALFRPIIWGLVLAYLINPFFRFFERRLLSRINPMGLRRTLSLILTYLTLFLLIGMLVALILPQLAASLMGLIQNFDIYISSAAAQYNKILRSVVESLERMGMTQTRLEPITPAEIKQWLSYLLNIDILMETAQKLLSTDGASSVLNALGGLVSALTDGIFAIFISLYLLVSKEKRHSQIMTFRRAMFSDTVNREITRACSVANNAFGKFIEGKLLEALIVALLTYVKISIVGIPYAPLIAAIMGVANIIPLVGPIIGAIPTAFIILLTDPAKTIPFLIIVVIIQQIDGNIIGPKILGSNTGISSLCVLVAITTMGALWGFVGMLFAVPVFATVLSIVSYHTEKRLRRKGLPSTTENYYPSDSMVDPAEDMRKSTDSIVQAFEKRILQIQKKKNRSEPLSRSERALLSLHKILLKLHVLPEIPTELLMQFTAEEASLAAKQAADQLIRELHGADLLENEGEEL